MGRAVGGGGGRVGGWFVAASGWAVPVQKPVLQQPARLEAPGEPPGSIPAGNVLPVYFYSFDEVFSQTGFLVHHLHGRLFLPRLSSLIIFAHFRSVASVSLSPERLNVHSETQLWSPSGHFMPLELTVLTWFLKLIATFLYPVIWQGWEQGVSESLTICWQCCNWSSLS